MKFFICERCKNIVEMVVEKGGKLVCCGVPMTELVPNSVDAAGEKHAPFVVTEGNKVTVKVGSIEHPMTEEHFIKFIWLETKNGMVYRKELQPTDSPEAVFLLNEEDAPVAAYEYCTLHGLWKTDIL